MNEKNLQQRDTLPTFQKPVKPAKISHIGKYKIETLLHKGSMSYLYLAKDPDTGDVAGKTASMQLSNYRIELKYFIFKMLPPVEIHEDDF